MEEQISIWKPILACLTLSIVYVASLYIWSSPFTRNEPATIRKRFFSVFVMSLISPLFLWYFLEPKYLDKNTLLETLGLRFPGLIQAMILPLLLTMVLFLGPLVLQGFSGIWQVYAGNKQRRTENKVEEEREAPEVSNEPKFWWTNVNDLMWVRNYIVAPLSEEFTFRACMLPLLLQVFRPNTAIFVAPLFFGAAHFNHLIERLKTGMLWRHALLISCFQFCYTFLFGGYSAFLFVRTGHFVAPFIAHAFCNHMGFPDLEEIYSLGEPRRCCMLILCMVGLVAWAFLLIPVTNPNLYSNNLWWR
uniref:CAAX prenyl protease 2 n=2 Tax=Cacopsylla melanoneura TaxID=428564 RepID=A0A8D8WMA1_9HEMI